MAQRVIAALITRNNGRIPSTHSGLGISPTPLNDAFRGVRSSVAGYSSSFNPGNYNTTGRIQGLVRARDGLVASVHVSGTASTNMVSTVKPSDERQRLPELVGQDGGRRETGRPRGVVETDGGRSPGSPVRQEGLTMPLYVVNINTNRGVFGPSADPLIQQLQVPPTRSWWHWLKETWIISTPEQLYELDARLRQRIEPADKLFILPLPDNYAGWLPPEAWQWIEQRIDAGENYQ